MLWRAVLLKERLLPPPKKIFEFTCEGKFHCKPVKSTNNVLDDSRRRRRVDGWWSDACQTDVGGDFVVLDRKSKIWNFPVFFSISEVFDFSALKGNSHGRQKGAILQPDAISEVKLGQCKTLDIVALASSGGVKEPFTRQTNTVRFCNLMQFWMLIWTG